MQNLYISPHMLHGENIRSKCTGLEHPAELIEWTKDRTKSSACTYNIVIHIIRGERESKTTNEEP